MSVSPVPSDPAFHENYRSTPFTIQAAASGNIESLQHLLKRGSNIKDAGPFCLSKRRRNVVSGNAISAAAYFGQAKMLKFVISRLEMSVYGCTASLEASGKGSGPFVPELQGF